MVTTHKRFLLALLFCFGATILPVFVLNLILLNNTLDNSEKVLLASKWQQITHGVTYAPTLSDTHLFKTLRLNDRLPGINTVVFGSSTALGITQSAFPANMHIYNYAQTGHALTATISEAEYLQQHAPQVKWLIVPMDWSIGFIYEKSPVMQADLSPESTLQQAASPMGRPPLLARMRDALSWPRVATLLKILTSTLGGEDITAAFRGYFIEAGSQEYRCNDGTAAKDFDIINRGSCTGFRHDGSATFANSARVSNAAALIALSVASNSKYRSHLVESRGIPSNNLLEHLAQIAKRARTHGGELVLFMPPLLPGLEAEFLRHSELAVPLTRTKRTLNTWARAHNITILDFGQSERFGCISGEFLDEHHAVASCYEKVFHQSRRDMFKPNDTTTFHGGLM
jgi:hypothetical protein